jgi:hypothetical protein
MRELHRAQSLSIPKRKQFVSILNSFQPFVLLGDDFVLCIAISATAQLDFEQMISQTILIMVLLA